MNLHPCPLCGESKGGYIASYVGSVLPVCCAACHRAVAYTRDRHSADEAWNTAASHAQGLRDRILELENEAREQALQALASEGQWIEQTGAQQKRIAELEAQLASAQEMNRKLLPRVPPPDLSLDPPFPVDVEGDKAERAHGIPSEYGYTAGAFAAQQKRIAALEHEAQFYKRRCDAMQEWQSRMRDPERTVVCDILANGFTLDPSTGRYAVLEAQRVPQWISVTERMPEPDSGEVLVWLTGGRCAFDEWHMHREDPTGMSTTHTIEMGLMWRDYEYEDITHWMPLPPPPVERAHGIEEVKR